jgi:hypothetical protein
METPPAHPSGRRSLPPFAFRALAWAAIPVAINFFILVRFWTDAPVFDDFDFMRSIDGIMRTNAFADWFQAVFAVANEHRAAVARLVGRALVGLTGGFDFRLLLALGMLALVGTFAFIWAEFRDEAAPAIVGAAAFLTFNWSYSEALLQATGALPHVGVMFIAFAALYFALRPGAKSAAACSIGGVLAVYTQANGLFVLPIAAVGCALARMWRRAFGLGALTVVIWALYFIGYQTPAQHPSPFKALEMPLKSFQFFLVNIGAIFPSIPHAQLIGGTLLAAFAWIAWKGLWRRHPTVFLWIAFVLLSAASMAAGRVGFGIYLASRYALNAALLMGILVFAIYSLTRPWRRGAATLAYVAAAVLWVAILMAALPEMGERVFKPRLLAEVSEGTAGSTYGLPKYVGVQHPSVEHGQRLLEMAKSRGWYSPPRRDLAPQKVSTAATPPPAARTAGFADKVRAEGRSLVIEGWTDIPPTVAREFVLSPADGSITPTLARIEQRPDVAAALQSAEGLLAGYRIEAAYPSEEAARAAASRICVYVNAPGHPTTRLVRPDHNCG